MDEIAEHLYSFYTSLIKAGFNDDQSMSIVLTYMERKDEAKVATDKG